MALCDRQTGWQGSLTVEDSLSAGSLTPGAANRGVGFWKIVVWTGLLLSGALYMVDPLEPFSYSAAPICRLAAEHVDPGLFVENKASGATVHPPQMMKKPRSAAVERTTPQKIVIWRTKSRCLVAGERYLRSP
jgi:hypothetical protein